MQEQPALLRKDRLRLIGLAAVLPLRLQAAASLWASLLGGCRATAARDRRDGGT